MTDRDPIINELTGLPARVDETTLMPAVKPEPRGGGWYLLGVVVIAVLGAAFFSEVLGLHPVWGATALWGLVLVFATLYHHVVRRRLRRLQRDLDVAQRSHLEEEVARAWNAPSRPAPKPWARNGRE